MSEIKLGKIYRVDIIESERGGGSKVDEVKYFDSEESAKEFCSKFNESNTEAYVPDWYMVAHFIGRV